MKPARFCAPKRETVQDRVALRAIREVQKSRGGHHIGSTEREAIRNDVELALKSRAGISQNTLRSIVRQHKTRGQTVTSAEPAKLPTTSGSDGMESSANPSPVERPEPTEVHEPVEQVPAKRVSTPMHLPGRAHSSMSSAQLIHKLDSIVGSSPIPTRGVERRWLSETRERQGIDRAVTDEKNAKAEARVSKRRLHHSTWHELDQQVAEKERKRQAEREEGKRLAAALNSDANLHAEEQQDMRSKQKALRAAYRQVLNANVEEHKRQRAKEDAERRVQRAAEVEEDRVQKLKAEKELQDRLKSQLAARATIESANANIAETRRCASALDKQRDVDFQAAAMKRFAVDEQKRLDAKARVQEKVLRIETIAKKQAGKAAERAKMKECSTEAWLQHRLARDAVEVEARDREEDAEKAARVVKQREAINAHMIAEREIKRQRAVEESAEGRMWAQRAHQSLVTEGLMANMSQHRERITKSENASVLRAQMRMKAFQETQEEAERVITRHAESPAFQARSILRQ